MRSARFLIAIALLGLVACGEEPTASGPTVSQYEEEAKRLASLAKENSGAPATAAAAAKKTARYVPGGAGQGNLAPGYMYSRIGKRDPFRSYVLEQASLRRGEGRGPLEQFELGQLSITAVVWDTNRARAVVRDPSGRTYIVGTGTPIGKNEGRIQDIQDGSMVVKETYVDYMGNSTSKDVEIKITSSGG